MTNIILKPIASLWIYILLIAVGVSACSVPKNSTESSSLIGQLSPRKNIQGTELEWEGIQNMYNELVINIGKAPQDNKLKLKLATLFINEARITGDAAYYASALKLLQYVMSQSQTIKEEVFLAKTYQASILLSLHQFAEAKRVAEEAIELNNYDAGVYGALVDANVELGNYDEAVKMCDKMLSIRPDLRSYSRVSYIRQIFGDNAGAIAAMKMAIQASPSGTEATEWARVNLGDLYLNIGKLDTAKWLYEAALHYRPQYPYAEMGLAKVARAEKKYDEALLHSQNAIKIMGESSFVSFLADIYALKGDMEKATEIRNEVLDLLEEGEAQNKKNTLAQHNGHRELAMAKMSVGMLQEALKDAMYDLNLRPKNVDANELVAWIYYKLGDMQNAQKYTDNALKMSTQNTVSLYKAAVIYAAAGDKAKAEVMKKQKQDLNTLSMEWALL